MIASLSDITEVRSVPLHASGLADYETCPRKFLFRHRAGLVSKSLDSMALLRGTMLHAYVAGVLRGNRSAVALIDGLAVAERKKAKLLLSPSGYLPGGQTLEEAFAGIEKARLIATAMSKAYCKFFNVGPGYIGELAVSQVEVNVLTTSDAGTLDVVAKGKGGWWIIDHKTHSRDLAAYAATLSLAPQTIMYPNLLRSSGITGKVLGIIYNIIKTPTITCCKTDDYDVNKYAARVEKWYEDQSDAMLRSTITLGKEQATLHAHRVAAGRTACVAPPVIPAFHATGGAACSQYNATCPFLPLCTSDTVTWKNTIERCYDKQWRDDSSEENN